MAPMPETNRELWEALDEIYQRQQSAIEDAIDSLNRLVDAQPEIGRDPLARDAWKAAIDRQTGLARFAESQRALAETMRGYWTQRSPAALPAPVAERRVLASGNLPPVHPPRSVAVTAGE